MWVRTVKGPSTKRLAFRQQPRSRRGKNFYGCTRYPDCDFTAWNRPVPTKCPECGHPYLEEKFLNAGTVLQCPNPECKHKEPVQKAS